MKPRLRDRSKATGANFLERALEYASVLQGSTGNSDKLMLTILYFHVLLQAPVPALGLHKQNCTTLWIFTSSFFKAVAVGISLSDNLALTSQQCPGKSGFVKLNDLCVPVTLYSACEVFSPGGSCEASVPENCFGMGASEFVGSGVGMCRIPLKLWASDDKYRRTLPSTLSRPKRTKIL